MGHDQLLETGIELAIDAGTLARDFFRKVNLRTGVKPDESLLSEADEAAEEVILEGLRNAFPDHMIVGEESIDKRGPDYFRDALEAEHVWVIDPIDGTNNFIGGDPVWCVSVAHMTLGRPNIGVIYFPCLGDALYFNRGAELRMKSQATDIASTEVTLSVPSKLPGARLFYAHDSFYRKFRMHSKHVPRISGSTVLSLLRVVLGHAIGAATSAHLWDFAAPLAFAASTDIEFRQTFTGRLVERFTPDDLYIAPEDPRRAWRVKEEYLFAPSTIMDELRDSIEVLRNVDVTEPSVDT